MGKHRKRDRNRKKKKKRKLSFSGKGTLEGGDYDQRIRVSGNLTIQDDVTALGLRGSGNVKAEGNVTLLGDMRCGGKMRISGTLKSENVRNSGKLEVGRGLVSSEGLRNSGRLIVETGGVSVAGHVRTGGKLFVKAGDLKAHEGLRSEGQLALEKGSLNSNGKLHISGHLNVSGDVTSPSEITMVIRTRGSIGGSVSAPTVIIGASHSVNHPLGQIKTTFPGQRAISKVFHVIAGQVDPLEIAGNVTGEQLFLDGVIIQGDVEGDSVALGSNCVVKGTVRYGSSIELEDGCSLPQLPLKIAGDTEPEEEDKEQEEE